MTCAVCESDDRVRLYGVMVDNKPLRLQVPLCGDHGDRYLILVGELLGQLLSGELGGKPRT